MAHKDDLLQQAQQLIDDEDELALADDSIDDSIGDGMLNDIYALLDPRTKW